MNQCSIQRNGVVRSREDLRNSFSGTVFSPDRRESVVCPKPRRVGILNGAVNDSSSSIRRHLSNQGPVWDSQPGSELLDIILSKGGHGSERSGTNSNNQVGLSSPFFCGSPPSRVSNPLIQDARFKEEKILPSIASGYPLPSSPALPQTVTPSSASARKGGCVRGNFGNNPVVRIEGFNCLNRERSRNCSIPALG